MEEHIEPRLLENLLKLGLNEKDLQDYTLRPLDTGESKLPFDLRWPSDGDPGKEPNNPPPPPGWFYRLDTDQLKQDLIKIFRNCLNGYSMQLRRNGRVIFSDAWHMAVLQLDGGPNHPTGIGWSADVPMHVASVSKLITAMAMTHLFESHNISPDSRIGPWLPPYWTRGAGVDNITFRDLLNHRSRFSVPGPPGECNFMFMKGQVAQAANGMPGYLNMNYALCRILLTTIDAPWLFKPLTTTSDTYWDLSTTRYYASYVNKNIFAPAGVTSGFDHADGNALAYTVNPTPPGFNSGDQSPRCGAVAWHFSTNDLLKLMAVFRRYGTMLPPESAQKMLERQFGIDVLTDTPLGRIYAKGAFWSEGAGVTVEQCNAFFLPKGMELVILANSTFCKNDTGFMGDVINAIRNNIKLDLFKTSVTAVSVLATLGFIVKKVRSKSPKK